MDLTFATTAITVKTKNACNALCSTKPVSKRAAWSAVALRMRPTECTEAAAFCDATSARTLLTAID